MSEATPSAERAAADRLRTRMAVLVSLVAALLAIQLVMAPEATTDVRDQGLRMLRGLVARREWEEVVAVGEGMLREYPGNGLLGSYVVQALSELGRLEQAVQVGRGVLAANGEAAAVRIPLVEVYAKLGDHAGAQAILEARGEVRDSAGGKIAALRLALSKGQPGEARRVLAELEEASPGLVQWRLLDAEILRSEGKLGAAAGKLWKLIKEYPEYDAAVLELAVVERARGRHDSAEGLLRRLERRKERRRLARLTGGRGGAGK